MYPLAQALRTQAELLSDMGDLEKALRTLDEAFDAARPYPNQLQLATLLKADLLHRLGRSEEAASHLRVVKAETSAGTLSAQIVRLWMLRLDSGLSGRASGGTLQAILAYLHETSSTGHLLDRLPLLAEALEYPEARDLAGEAMELIGRIRAALPEKYRPHFEQKPYVQRVLRLAMQPVTSDVPSSNNVEVPDM